MNQAAKLPGLYSAAQIARAAGISRQAVEKRLAGSESVGHTEVDGRPAAAWQFGALPIDWQMEITRRGVSRRFDNGEAYLAAQPVVAWKAPLAWGQVPQREQAKAARLQKALAGAMAIRFDPGAESRLETVGLADFKAEFGYAISARHWRRLLARTIERDGGAENWQRLEIYLDDRAFAVPSVKPEVMRGEHKHRELDGAIGSLENRQNPTAVDRQFLWDAVFRHFESKAAELSVAGADADASARVRALKASLVSYLFKAFPERTICPTMPTLKRRFNEKLAKWVANGRTPAALEDRRPVKSGRFKERAFDCDLRKIRDRAIQLDGNESLAHRMLREEGKLSKEFCEAYPFDPRQGKSELPASVRTAITAEVDMCLPLRRGPWQAKLRGPYIPRDWSDVKPGDWFNADDVTWNHYFKERLPDGRWTVMRGECLVMTDLRTGYPLDFLLIPGHYNGEHVRGLALKVHDQVGLPRAGFYFEQGVWKSRLVAGDRRQGTPVHWREAESGLCSLGLKTEMRFATTPRAKPIEGIFRILQERMRCIPGFVGFNERAYDAERIQPLLARAARGDTEALAKFPTAPEWASKVRAVLDEYAHDPQNGKMLEGRSPAEAWGEAIRVLPLRKLADASRYILSTHQKKVTVQQEGIVLTIRGRRYLYYNERTGPLIGREVLAFYNLEMPELLTVCDMKRQNYFSVKRVELPAMSATREQFEEVNNLRKGHMAAARVIFGELRHEVVSTVTRDNEHSEESRELGRFHNEQMDKAQAEKSERGRKIGQLQRELASEGIRLDGPVRDVDEALDAVEKRRMYLARLEAREQETATESEP